MTRTTYASARADGEPPLTPDGPNRTDNPAVPRPDDAPQPAPQNPPDDGQRTPEQIPPSVDEPPNTREPHDVPNPEGDINPPVGAHY